MTKDKKNIFKDAFINKDKDYFKKVNVTIQGEQYHIATIKFLTQYQISQIYQSLANKSILQIKQTDKPEDTVNMTQFIHQIAVKSIVEWVFDEQITIDNITYLKDIWKTPIMDAINELRITWQNK